MTDMDFFDKLAIALFVWGGILLLASGMMWPVDSWQPKNMLKPAKRALWAGFTCALTGTLVVVFE